MAVKSIVPDEMLIGREETISPFPPTRWHVSVAMFFTGETSMNEKMRNLRRMMLDTSVRVNYDGEHMLLVVLDKQ